MAKTEKQEVKVWSSVGTTLPIPDTYASIRFSFGHERLAKSDSQKDLTQCEGEIHAFNTEILNRRLEEHRRLVEELVSPKKKKGKRK